MIEIRQVPARSRARVADPRLGALATAGGGWWQQM